MKRIWSAAAILLLILVLGGIGMATVYRKITFLDETILQARQAGLDGETQKALELAQNASRQWEKDDPILSVIIRHDQLENLVYSIDNMIPHLEQEQMEAFVDDCTNCSITLQRIWESEVPSLENIL